MKRFVSLGASLFAAAALLAGCGGKPPDKSDLAAACMKRMGGVQEKCDCYVAAIEKALAPDDFAKLAKGVRDNEDYSGADWLPSNVSRIPAISDALQAATATCLASA